MNKIYLKRNPEFIKNACDKCYFADESEKGKFMSCGRYPKGENRTFNDICHADKIIFVEIKK